MDHGLICPHCQAQYRKAYRLGRELTCKSCGQTFVAGDVVAEAPTEKLCGDVCAKSGFDGKEAKAKALAARGSHGPI